MFKVCDRLDSVSVSLYSVILSNRENLICGPYNVGGQGFVELISDFRFLTLVDSFPRAKCFRDAYGIFNSYHELFCVSFASQTRMY